MRILFGLATISLFYLLTSFAVKAELMTVSDQKILQKSKSLQAAEIVTAWNIEPFSRVNGMMSGECIMYANYDNGFELAFKGKQNRLTALRLRNTDGRHSERIKGFIGLVIGDNSYGLQSKSRSGQVDASLLTVPAVGELINSSEVFDIRVGDKHYSFSSAGFKAGYDALMKCQRQYIVTTLKVVDESRPVIVEPKIQTEEKIPPTPQMPILEDSDVEPMEPIAVRMQKGKNNMPLAMALPMLLPSGYAFQFDGTVNAMAPVSWDASGDWEKDLRQAVAMQGYIVDIQGQTVKISTNLTHVEIPTREPIPVDPKAMQMGDWRANKGDSLINTLNGWAKKAGVKTDIRLDNDPVLKQDFFMDGSFEVAVNTLLNRLSHETSIKASALLTDTNDVAAEMPQSEVSTEKPKVNASATERRWRALEGMDLRRVLMQWSDMENIQLIWDTDKRFLVRNNVKMMSDYADAVTMILSQYEGQKSRPVAKLNIDPKTGEKALIITIDG